MRIDSNYRFPSSMQRKTQNNDLLFEAVLKDAAKQEEEKQEDKKGKLVTTREGAYIRQYIVRPDGSRVLLSETRQSVGTDDMGNDQNLPDNAPLVQSGISQSTKEIIVLLNFQAGAGIPFSVYKQEEKLD
ncbi:hypothetical protein [Paenibacillus thiaminolyticus]|uniref:Uncharacterized protein n=1 Tax=Paenibacillus thiaminolyticus TaxID=49283 RepID=A0A3A3GJA2_PANTH|nr:hypothetical protein [Paenibacillus thiaminolyticus]RJG22458.1 hypothetical protein DQX05_17510 [Paenibacillus thiaminolyticus]